MPEDLTPDGAGSEANLGLRPFGLILAGGRSRRMGGGHKTLERVAGRTILDRIVECLAPQCDGLAINAREPSRWSAFAGKVLADTVEGDLGPLAGVLAGLEHLDSGTEPQRLLLTVAGDLPFLPRDLALRLASARTKLGATTACAASGGRHHPTVALWPVSLRGDLERALERRDLSVAGFQDRCRHAVESWTIGPVDPFFNVNTPEDLAQADRLARASGS